MFLLLPEVEIPKKTSSSLFPGLGIQKKELEKKEEKAPPLFPGLNDLNNNAKSSSNLFSGENKYQSLFQGNNLNVTKSKSSLFSDINKNSSLFNNKNEIIDENNKTPKKVDISKNDDNNKNNNNNEKNNLGSISFGGSNPKISLIQL